MSALISVLENAMRLALLWEKFIYAEKKRTALQISSLIVTRAKMIGQSTSRSTEHEPPTILIHLSLK